MISIRVDGELLFRGSVTEWAARPPDIFRDAINPNANPEPWLKAIAINVAEAVVTNKSLKVEVWTKPRGWGMEVENG